LRLGDGSASRGPLGSAYGFQAEPAQHYTYHLDAWVIGCDQLKIPITAMNAKGPVEEYWRKKGHQPQPHQSGPSHLQFSQEAFIDALVKFIIADDQVCHSIIQPS
jgi:hypothetical protein